MGAWTGNWDLKVSSDDYADLNVGRFTLKKVPSKAGKYRVHTSPKSKKATWLGIEFQLVAGVLPALPWPVANASYLDDVGYYIKDEVKNRWAQEGRSYECLVGDVMYKGAMQPVVLIKVDKGMHKDKDILVGLLQIDASGGVNPDGSVSGTRR